jgi:predicted ester cyclase
MSSLRWPRRCHCDAQVFKRCSSGNPENITSDQKETTVMLSHSILATVSVLLPFVLPLATIGCGPSGAGHASTPSDAQEPQRTLALRYFNDMWNPMNASVADEIIARDVTGHVGSATLHHIDALKDRISVIGKVYETSHFTVEAIVVEKDTVAVRWTQRAKHSGMFLGPETRGKEVTVSGMHLFRIANGKIAEIWVNADDLGELQQLGVNVPDGV